MGIHPLRALTVLRYGAAVRYALGLLILAVGAAAVVAYGIDPIWMRWGHGLGIIMWSRRWQWLLVAVAIAACVAVVGLIISGKARVGWLIGLLPVLALFSHRFLSGPLRHVRVVENPPLVDGSAAHFLRDSDDVIGVRFENQAYALPLASLYRAPMVLLSGRQNRLAVFWSPGANRVLAVVASRQLRAANLEVIGFPADAVLIYDSLIGQFINGLTGLTPAGSAVPQLQKPLQTVELSWQRWRAMEPGTKVLAPIDPDWRTAPSAPIAPNQPMPAHRLAWLDPARVCLLQTVPPLAIPAGLVTTPINVDVGNQALLILIDPADHSLRAFSRMLGGDLVPRFAPFTDPKRPAVKLIDTDTNTEWTLDGRAVTGDKAIVGKRLKAIVSDSNLPLGVLRFWYPNLHVLSAGDILPVTAPVRREAGEPRRVPRSRHRHGINPKSEAPNPDKFKILNFKI